MSQRESQGPQHTTLPHQASWLTRAPKHPALHYVWRLTGSGSFECIQTISSVLAVQILKILMTSETVLYYP